VLVQLTSTGWQLVVNGQLIPYASGVLGDQLAAQTILQNASTANLLGSQFCVGYGGDGTGMIASGNLQLIAVIPDPNASSAATGSCDVGGAIPGGVMTSFATRGTVTPTAPMFGSFALANTSVMYIVVRGQSLKTLGYTQNPLDLPNVRVYDASGNDVLSNASGGVTVAGCPGSAPVNNYYANFRGGALDVNDTCVSAPLAAGVYSFTINPNTSSSAGELLFEVTVNPMPPTGGVLTSFATRGTVTPTAPVYGSFALANTSVMYIAVRGQSLKTLGYTNNPLDLPNLRVYDASGNDVLQNASGGVTVIGCPSSATVNNYYAIIRGGPLNVNDTCVSATLAAGVNTFTINPNTSSSSGELLFEVTVNP
jgi:hypothetical protein